MPDLGIIRLEYENNKLSCLKSAPPNFSHCKILKKKTKMLKFGTKNALFEYFWPKMLYLGIFGQNFNKAIVIFEIKHPQIYLFAKSHENKNA